MVHDPNVNASTDTPLGLTTEKLVEARNSCYDSLHQRCRTLSETSAAHLQCLLQSVRH